MLPHGFTAWTMFFISFHPQHISPLEDAQGLKSYPPRPVFQRFLRSIVFMGCRKTSWVLNMIWMWLMSFLYGSKVMCFVLAHVFCQLLLGQEITTKMPVMYHHQSHTKNPSRSHLHPGRERVPHPNKSNKYLIHEQKNSGFSILLSSIRGFRSYFSCRKKMSTKFKHWLKQHSMSHPSRKNET